ncbi:MAG TPA: hypothetical protein VGM98_07140 [Schlesneria sp.]|jgi:hypothetical protein
MMTRSFNILTALVALGLFSGCGGSNEKETASVQGLITFRGEPLSGATVFFVPEKGPRATADTDAKGVFKLMTYRPGDGAVPGDFKISVAKYVIDPTTANNPTPSTKNEVPERYGNATTSMLRAKVEKGKKNEFKFELTE